MLNFPTQYARAIRSSLSQYACAVRRELVVVLPRPFFNMAERSRATDFTEFEKYRLTGVRLTERQLGHGSYATVQELEYLGLKCAGKKIHDLLLQQGDASYTLRRFEEECRLLSQVRHPNIVQFLGVHFQRGVRVPILVMEYLPTNLTSCIEQYGILPKEISYSILHDVAMGLCHLHSQTPPIIHRDLSSNNVLLTANMTGKISDLGVARILNLTPLQVSRMTNTPGTPAYMPPEVMVANPKYDASVDEFSYGTLMIHMFSGQWPEPQIGPNRFQEDMLVPVTEAERREVFLRAIGNDHPLMDLILKCINNNPRNRAHACEIVERLAAMNLRFSASFANRLDMLRHIQHQEEDNLALREEKATEIQRNQQHISKLEEDARERAEENVRLDHVYSTEVEQLKLQVRDLDSQNQSLVAKSKSNNAEFKIKLAAYEILIEENTKTFEQARRDIESQQRRERETLQKQITDLESQVSTQRENYKLQLASNDALLVENSRLKSSANSLQHENSTLKAEFSRKDAELQAKDRILKEKNSIISGMSQQLTKAREYLSSKKQVSYVSIYVHHIFTAACETTLLCCKVNRMSS